MKKTSLLLLMALLASGFALAQPKPSGFGDLNHELVFTPGGGLVFPVGDFDDNNDMGFSVGGGMEYFVSPRLALLAGYSYQSFGDPRAGVNGESFHFLGMGARGLLFKDARLNPYLRAAGGLYQGSNSSKSGVNFGPGILYRASKNVGLWAEANAHFVFDYGSGLSSSTANFLGVSAGLMLTIPTGKKARTIGRRPGESPPMVVKEEKRQEAGAEAPKAEPGVELAPVYFDFDRYDLRADARAVLEKNLGIFQKLPGLKVELEGNCDEAGTDEYNLQLGWKRADAVRDYLIKAGIDAARLARVSYGKTRPSFLGNDPDSHAKNRRVDFKILSR